MTGPLDGVKVVEITLFQQGPVAGMRLGDLGADVIKVEPPKGGDPGRGFMRVIGTHVGLKGRNFYFEGSNRNKRSIVLDLTKERGKEIFFELIERADVFLTNMTIGAEERLGIGPEILLARYPRLIYAHASGWGRSGPDAEFMSNDYIGIARSGLMATCGEEGSPPQPFVPGLADELGGLISTFAVCAALYAREKTGKGQLVDTSLMGAAMSAIRMALEAPAMLGQEFPRAVRTRTGNPLWNHYRCKDDKWLVIAALQPDRYWPNVCKALGMEELEHDPRFETLEARSDNCEELIAIMDRIIASKAREQWEEIFKREGVLYTLIQTPTEVINDQQAIANEYVIWFDHPVFGRTKTIGFPWKFSNTPCSVRREAPEYGQHAEEILLELGYSWEDITKLKEEEVTI